MSEQASLFLQNLAARAGSYEGTGINHENEHFTGSMVIRAGVSGGVVVWFRAQGLQRQIFHEETVLIGMGFDGGLAMASLNTNMPALQHFVSESISAAECSFIHGDFASSLGFRERVTINLTGPGELSYHFAWGMPGQPVEDRSAVTMTQTPAVLPDESTVR